MRNSRKLGRRFTSPRGRGRGEWESNTVLWGQSANVLANAIKLLPLVSLIPPTPTPVGTSSVFAVGEYVVTEIDAHVDFIGPLTAAGSFQLACGIFKSNYDVSSATFQAQNPVLLSDAIRDNWFSIWTKGFSTPTSASYVAPTALRYSARVRARIPVRNGEGLFLVVANSVNSPGGIVYVPWVRFRILKEF